MKVTHTSLTMLLALLVGVSPVPLTNTVAAQRQPSKHASQRQVSRAKGLFKAEMGARTSFDAARKLLRGKGLPFDPDALRHPQWRKNLAKVFEQMPEMQVARWGGDKLEGLYVAHTLYLPERVETTGDTFILVRNLIHEGRNVLIKGSGNLYVFPVERVGLLGTTMEEAFKGHGLRFTKGGHGFDLPGGHATPPLIQDGGITINHNVHGVGTTGDEGAPFAPRFPSITPRNSGTDASGCRPATGYACGDYSEVGAGDGCYTGGSGSCAGYSPVLIDVEGDGFSLTDGAGGVAFDLNGDGQRERLSWTSPDSDDAWLVLDRDGDGVVDNGRELFGNYTWQLITPAPNGFLALKEFDYPVWGGAGSDARGDGVIDDADGVFSLLRLWRDANHNGVSEPGELHSLASLGVSAIHLAYKESKREDAHGNKFRYRARVGGAKGGHAGRWAWDVFLIPAF